jgi:hypothetical protein
VTGSLEDLVNSFDEKLSQCFRDYQEQAEKIAPVQVRMLLISIFQRRIEKKFFFNRSTVALGFKVND